MMSRNTFPEPQPDSASYEFYGSWKYPQKEDRSGSLIIEEQRWTAAVEWSAVERPIS